MSYVKTVTTEVRQLGNVAQQTITAVKRLPADLGLSGSQPGQNLSGQTNRYTLTAFYQTLKPAEYKGIKFAVLTSVAEFGRRNVLHQYPFRDTPWVEDLGRGARKITMQGFLLHRDQRLGGGTLQDQMQKLIKVAETQDKNDQGELIHPTLGRLNVALVGNVKIEENWDKGRMALVTFVFVERGSRINPATADNTISITASASYTAQIEAKASFVSRAVDALNSGAAVIQQAVNVSNRWTAKALKISNDAANILSLAKALPQQINTTIRAITTTSPVAMAATKRKAVRDAAAQVQSSASALTVNTAGDVPDAARSLALAVKATTNDQAGALRALFALTDIDDTALNSVAPVGADVDIMDNAIVSLYRRQALMALAESTAEYQPLSYDDAISLRDRVLALLDTEITAAGNDFDDGSFLALRALRAAVYKDLTERGAKLAVLINLHSNSPLPAPVLALRQYQDTGRADELIERAKPIHPAFMPVDFLVLSR